MLVHICVYRQFHRACVGGSQFAQSCPSCQGQTVAEWDGKSTAPAAAGANTSVVDLTSERPAASAHGGAKDKELQEGGGSASGGGSPHDPDDEKPLGARAAAAPTSGGGADAGSWLGKTAAAVGQMLVGGSISKLFPKYGYFKGEIKSFDAMAGMFSVAYEDGDEETMTLAQLSQLLSDKSQAARAREYLGLPARGGAGPGSSSGGGGAAASKRGGKRAASPDANEAASGQRRKRDGKRGGKQAASPGSGDSGSDVESDGGSDVEFFDPPKKEPDVINISDSESDYSSEEEEDSEDSEWEDQGSSTKGQAKIKVGKVTIEAFCIDVDEDEHGGGAKQEPGRGDEAQQSEAGVANEEVRKKIRKMLQLGLHPDTPDAEAQQALKNANRFLTRYNLQQVDILKEAEEEGQESSLAGGMKVALCLCCRILHNMKSCGLLAPRCHESLAQRRRAPPAARRLRRR